jgi:hypothetical protein
MLDEASGRLHRGNHPAEAPSGMARFYVPALGAIALLGAWLVTRLPRRETMPAAGALACTAVIAVMFGLGIASFHAMVRSQMGGARIVHACPGGLGHLPVRAPGPGHCSPVTRRHRSRPA